MLGRLALQLAAVASVAFAATLPKRQLATFGIVDAVTDAAAVNALLTSTSFTYVIVGGGNSGLALAARLSEKPAVTVAVLEAGVRDDANLGIIIPAQAGSTLGTSIDWGFSTVPQANANGRSIYTPRGKVLGGSSAINFLIFTKGTRVEYDAWAGLGNPTWTWSSIQEFSKKSEQFTIPTAPSTASNFTYVASAHGTSGPVDVSFPPYLPPQFGGFNAAVRSLGVSYNNDVDDGSNAGVTLAPSTVTPSTQSRETSQTAYINGILATRTNLLIITRAQATKVNFGTPGSAGVVASGVTFVAGGAGAPLVINAAKEVILSAGSIQTPQLLELSGIGNPAILNPLGISTVVNLPGVGENLQDHPASVNVYRLKAGVQSLDDLSRNNTLLAEQGALYAQGQGMLTTALSAAAYLKVSDFLSVFEMIRLAQLVATSGQAISSVQRAIQAAYLLTTPMIEALPINVYFGGATAEPQTSYLSLASCLQHSFSRGTVHITSSNPLTPPAIDPAYLQHPVDKFIMSRAAKYLRRVANTPALQRFIASEQEPGPSVSSDADWEEFIEANVRTEYHPVGTAAMLPQSQNGVVSPALKVYGTANLRVVDLSIAPIHVSAHPMSLAYGLAEKAASIILAA